MIMVRRNELACRDEWSQSLWTAREGGEAASGDVFQRPPNLGPVSPIGMQRFQSLLGNKENSSRPSIDGEDVLLSEARIVSEPRQIQSPADHPYSSGHFDPRTAVFRAREAYRDRNRAKESFARHSAGAEPISPAEDGEEERVGEREERRIGEREVVEPEPEKLESGEVDLRSLTSGRNELLPAALEAPPVLPILPVLPHGTTNQTPLDPLPIELAKGVPPAKEWALERLLTEPISPREANLAVEPNYPELSFDRLYEFSAQKLPDWFRTDLPQTCRTCRDYRPAGDGLRGWCMNAWAFDQQTLVHEDQLAPCESAIGHWWAPVDDVWLVAADVSSHGRATPLLDRFVAQELAEKRRSRK